MEHVQLDEPELVYNFTVKGPHTYFVLDMRVLVHNDSEGVCDPDAYPHLLNNLQTGGFSTEQSQEIVRRLYDAGVSNEQMRQMDEVFANAHIVEKGGFQLMVSNDNVGNYFWVWRFADRGHLYSNFSRLDPMVQKSILSRMEWDGQKIGMTGEEYFLSHSASRHALGDKFTHQRSPLISTGGQLSKIVNTTDKKLYNLTVTNSDTLYLLRIPEEKLNFDLIVVTSETEILANAMRDPLDAYVVVELPNVFRDKPFTDSLRQTP